METGRHILLSIKPDGSGYEVKPVGFVGTQCLKATSRLETALGTVDERDRRLTEAYYQVLEQEQPLLQQQQLG